MLLEPPQTGILQHSAVGPQLYHALRDRIVQGALPPGSRLSETEIATAYEVSRQPVREAFIKLAEESLVEVRPQRGTYVRKIVVAAVMSARFMREAIEADIVAEVARTAEGSVIDRLRQILGRQRALVADADSTGFVASDEAFHRALAGAAGQAASWDILQTLNTPMNRVRHLSARRFPFEGLIAQHETIVDAIAAHDPAAASAAMRAHLRGILNDLPAVIDALPDYFDRSDR